MRKGGLTFERTPLSRAYALTPEARGLRPSLGRDEWQHTNRQGTRLAAGERERSAVSWRPRRPASGRGAPALTALHDNGIGERARTMEGVPLCPRPSKDPPSPTRSKSVTRRPGGGSHDI